MGCFPGARLYNSEDPVPGLASVAGFLHPKITEIRMSGHGGGQDIQTWDCNDVTRKDQPEFTLDGDADDHKMSFYIQRMQMVKDNLQKRGKDSIFSWAIDHF